MINQFIEWKGITSSEPNPIIQLLPSGLIGNPITQWQDASSGNHANIASGSVSRLSSYLNGYDVANFSSGYFHFTYPNYYPTDELIFEQISIVVVLRHTIANTTYFGDYGSNSANLLQMSTTDNTNYDFIEWVRSNNNIAVVNTFNYPLNTWYIASLTYNNLTKNTSFWYNLNRASKNSPSITSLNLKNGSQPVLGNFPQYYHQQFVGQIAEFVLWDKELSISEMNSKITQLGLKYNISL